MVCNEPRRRRDDQGVEIVPVEEFLDGLWAGLIVEGPRPGPPRLASNASRR
ncbi:MAG: hypothetical protein J4F37_02280 [Acidobacteria bacterium]|nr:hypothetical protein [Acidobacteriota bacterium]